MKERDQDSYRTRTNFGLDSEMLPIFMAVFLFFTNKQYIMQLFTDRIGQIMLAVAVLNELIGIYIIKRIVSIGL